MATDPETRESTEAGTIRLKGLDDDVRESRNDTAPTYEVGAAEREEKSGLNRGIHLFPPSNMDRAIFCRNLATLIEVGIPLLQALRMLSRRTEHPKLAEAIKHAADRVEEGQTISQAMRERENVFGPMVVNIVQVGEVGGILEASLRRLADIMEMRATMRRKIRSAAMYPSIVLLIALAVIIVVLTMAVPVFARSYSEARAELPGITQFVLNLSNWLQAYIWLWLPLLILLVIGFILFLRTSPGKEFTSHAGVYGPGVRGITKKIAVARFARTLSSLLQAGIPLSEAIAITADTNENLVIRRSLKRVQNEVEHGNKMGQQLAKERIFPPMVVDMISIGEETGTLDRMLDKIADIYDDEAQASLDGISTIIEPVLIVILGLVVLGIALSVMLPYFNLVNVV